MRILLLNTDLEPGGTPTVVRELAIRLKRVGIDVEVACLGRWGPVADQLRNAGVEVTALGAAGARDLRILPRLIHLIRRRKFITVFSFLVHANAMAAAASLAVREVRWIQSIQTTQPTPRWHWFVQRLAQHAAERIVVPSPSVADVAVRWAGVSREKMAVIPNAIDLSDWADSQSPIPAANPRPYPITFLGRLDPIKDVPTLVRAAKILSPLVHLHIYGDGEDRARIERTIVSQGGDEVDASAVTMHGSIASPRSALVQSGLLVLPSLAEGFGLVLIEAMAAGVPVVATEVPGIRDVVRDGVTGLLVEPSNPSALAGAIRRIVEDRDLRDVLIRNGKREVLERFSWDAILIAYQALLTTGTVA